MLHTILRLLFALLSPSLALGASPQAPADLTLLRQVRVVSLEDGSASEPTDLLIEGDRIRALGALEVPEGATVVDGGGAFVLPGLNDMHVHLHEEPDDMLSLYLARGVTTVQSMHGGPLQLDLRARVRRGEVLGPRIFTTGPTTARERVHTVDDARQLVRRQKAAGFDAIKMYGDGSNTMPAETYAVLLAEAKKAGLPVVGHAPRNLPFVIVLEEGQASIDHMEEIVYTDAGLGRLLAPYVDMQFGRTPVDPRLVKDLPDFATELEDEIADLAAHVASTGLVVTPTLVAFTAIQNATDERIHERLARPELAFVHPLRRAEWTPQRQRFRQGGWSENLDFFAAYLDANLALQRALTKAFHDAGVTLLPGTDAPFDYVVRGFGLHEELAHFVACGLSPLEALRTAIVNPATFRGAQDEGRVAPGCRADLVLFEANPAEDIAHLDRILGVVAAGRFLSRETLDRALNTIVERHTRLEALLDPLLEALETGDVERALSLFARLTDPDARTASFVESAVNERGYALLRAGNVEAAVAVFASNTATFPAAFNAWDSLGEARMEQGALAEALAHYERSLALNPDNANARERIEELKKRLDP